MMQHRGAYPAPACGATVQSLEPTHGIFRLPEEPFPGPSPV
jgi:hypothetical protein